MAPSASSRPFRLRSSLWVVLPLALKSASGGRGARSAWPHAHTGHPLHLKRQAQLQFHEAPASPSANATSPPSSPRLLNGLSEALRARHTGPWCIVTVFFHPSGSILRRCCVRTKGTPALLPRLAPEAASGLQVLPHQCLYSVSNTFKF